MADKFPDDPLDALNFSIEDEDLNFSPKKTVDKEQAASSFRIGDELKRVEPRVPITLNAIGHFSGGIPSRQRGSGDRLCSKEASLKNLLNNHLAELTHSDRMVQGVKPDPIYRPKTADVPGNGVEEAAPPFEASMRKRLSLPETKNCWSNYAETLRDKDRAASLFGIGDEPKKVEPRVSGTPDIGGSATGVIQPRKRGGSGDWLGLQDASPLDILNDDLAKPSVNPPHSAKPTPTTPKESTFRPKTADVFGGGIGSTEKATEPLPKVPMRKRLNILDDLFGDSSFTKEKEKPKTPMFGNNTDPNSSRTLQLPKKESSEEFSYLPSMSDRRKLGDKQTPSTPKTTDPSDWLLEPKDRAQKQTDAKRELPKTSTPSRVTTPQAAKRTVQKDSGSGLPSWLSSGFNDPPIPPETQALSKGYKSHIRALGDQNTASKSGVDPLPSTAVQMTQDPLMAHDSAQRGYHPTGPVDQEVGYQQVPAQQMYQPVASQPMLGFQQQPIQQPAYFPSAIPPLSGTMDPQMIGQLTDMHAQIGAAMMKHQQNLQSYMQAILFEAQRVGLSQNLEGEAKRAKSDPQKSENSDGNTASEEESEKKEIHKKSKSKTRKDPKIEKIKRQELEIQEMEIQISKLELQVAQLELKNANIEDVKLLEIESLKKTHGFEVSAWESRYERAKENFDEVVKEYEEKISKLKKKVEELEAQHKERIEALQSERMSDLEKLGEFHRTALEQAANITLPQVSGLGAVRLPMKIMQKPEDESELVERETALLEKEKQVEILRQKLELEKVELDEIRETEKIRREEREREIRRMTMETKLKEEMITKEFERKKEQMEAVQSQIEKMREEAMKEQAELTKEKLALSADKARMEAAANMERTSESPQLQPLDVMRARAELEAGLEAVKEAREAADRERRRHVELRKAVEETTWDQKDKEQQLEMRERHVASMLKEAEAKRLEATSALDKTQTLKEELETKQREIKEHLKQIETKEKVLATERMEIAREKVELEKKKTQLEILLPELTPAEDLIIQGTKSTSSQKEYVDPKALIMRLKAERDLQHYIAPIRNHQPQRL